MRSIGRTCGVRAPGLFSRTFSIWPLCGLVRSIQNCIAVHLASFGTVSSKLVSNGCTGANLKGQRSDSRALVKTRKTATGAS